MEPSRILIAEDDPATLDLIARALGKRGYQLEKAEDGRKALLLACEHTPDLVISDVMMPRMDGWEFVRSLRARPETAFTPVVFLTALDSAEHRLYGFNLGADDYIPKPFSPRELDERVLELLKRAGGVKDRAREAVASDGGVWGHLDEFGLSALLTMLEAQKKTGLLELHRGGETACLYFREGRLVGATLGGNPELSGMACFYRVMSWSDGAFAVTPVEVKMPDEIDRSISELLLDAARWIGRERS